MAWSFSITGQWLNLHAATGQPESEQLLMYADGGNIAAAVSSEQPENLAYGVEAYQGEQLTAGGDGAGAVWVRATSGGSAIVKVQRSTEFAARKLQRSRDMTLEEWSLRAGRSYTASTGPTGVLAGQILAVTLNNPSDSGRDLFLVNRLFSDDSAPADENLEYIAYINPTVTLANSVTPPNLSIGGPASTSEFKYEVDSIANITMGGITGTGEILPNGRPYSRPLLATLPPGTGLGITVQGAGQNLNQASRVSVTFEWFEEAVL